MDESTITLMAVITEFTEQNGYLPGENLYDLIENLVERGLLDDSEYSNDQLAEALTLLIKTDILNLNIEKGQFLHFHLVVR